MGNYSIVQIIIDPSIEDSLNLEKITHKIIDIALEKNNGNRTKTAKDLGICIRTLRNWINKKKEIKNDC